MISVWRRKKNDSPGDAKMSVPRCEVAGEIYDVLGSDSGNDRSGTEGEVPDVDNSATQAAHTARIDTKVIRSSKTHQRLRESRNENQGALQVWVKKWTLAPKKKLQFEPCFMSPSGNSGKDESGLYLEHQCSRLTLYPVYKKYSSTYLVQNEVEMKVNIDTFGVPVSEKLAEV